MTPAPSHFSLGPTAFVIPDPAGVLYHWVLRHQKRLKPSYDKAGLADSVHPSKIPSCGGLLTDLNWKWESGSDCLIKGFQNVSGSALEPDRDAAGWVGSVSMSPGTYIPLQGHLMYSQTSPVYITETLLSLFFHEST